MRDFHEFCGSHAAVVWNILRLVCRGCRLKGECKAALLAPPCLPLLRGEQGEFFSCRIHVYPANGICTHPVSYTHLDVYKRQDVRGALAEYIKEIESTDSEERYMNLDWYYDFNMLLLSLIHICDTLACITGGIAEAFSGMPQELRDETLKRLPEDIRKASELLCFMIAKMI